MKTPSDHPLVAGLQRYRVSGQTMGSRYSAVFFAVPDINEAAINAGLFAAVDAVDRQMSNWNPNSDLSRLNAAPVNEWQPVPQPLFDVIACSLAVGQESRGAFDIGVGEMVSAWGFGASKGRVDEQKIRDLEGRTHRPATDLLELDAGNRRVRKRAAVTLDLSGIAKGYGVDQMAACLDGLGIGHYLVGIDGEMRARDAKPDGVPWAIAIEKPVRHVRDVMGVMELRDAAIATSGDYRHWLERHGQSVAHTFSGAMRAPVSNRLACVSVVAANCMQADAWATALLVLGEKAGVEMAQSRAMDALFVLHDGEGFQEISIEAGQVISAP